MNGKCPKCEKVVASLNLNGVTASVFLGKKWNAVTYSCPHCATILGCQIDPVAIKTDTVNEIIGALKKYTD